jgi:hypothetical protein
LRRIAGIVLLAWVVLVAVAFVAGLWNPWRLVVLSEYFGNWPLGLLVVAFLAFLTSWVLLPVRHEAVQGLRIGLRFATAIALFAGVACFGVFGNSVGGTHRVLAQSPDGQRAIALFERSLDERELRVWAGSGLATREVGVLGRACGTVEARFTSRNEVDIATAYGDFHVRLDPATGAPLDGLGSSCTG